MDCDCNTAAPKVAIKTLGCAKNEVDSNRMATLLKNADFNICDDLKSADVLLVNTCSFLKIATEESIETILELAKNDETSNKKIVVCGCMPSRYGIQTIKSLFPEIDACLDTKNIDSIVDVVQKITGFKSSVPKKLDICRSVESKTFAYVKISEGCSRNCAFCTIPHIRGPYRSRDFESIASEVNYFFDHGVKEVILIGQDTGLWGHDLPDKKSLSWLLTQLATIAKKYKGYIRVLYLQPDGLDDELIQTFKRTPEILNYIDIPIQHASQRILKLMNRSGNHIAYKDLFKKLRSEIPDIVLRTTLIAGFPGETDRDFNILTDFLHDVEFDYCGVFIFSPEEGTKAYQMPNQVPDEIKLERAQILQDISENIGFAKAQERLNSKVKVLIEGDALLDNGHVEHYGRAWFQSPDDLDGVVYVEGLDTENSQEFVEVTLNEAVCYDFFATKVNDTISKVR